MDELVGYYGYIFADNNVILGRGRQCIVKLATSTRYSTPRKVAIKIAESTPASIKEANILLKLSHEHVVDIYDFFIADGKTCLVLALAEKGNLRNFVRQRGRIGQMLAVKMCRQIFDALTYLHDMATVAHGDLKCENVLVDASEDLKIADFGQAIEIADSCTALTSTSDERTGEAVNSSSDVSVRESDVCTTDLSTGESISKAGSGLGGSSAYSAPEILDSTSSDLRAADVWSGGVIAFYVLTTYLPFGCQGHKEIRSAMERRLCWPRPLNKIKKSLRTFVEAALNMEPKQRPKARQLFDCIRAFSTDE